MERGHRVGKGEQFRFCPINMYPWKISESDKFLALVCFLSMNASATLFSILLQHAITSWRVEHNNNNSTTKGNKALNNPSIQNCNQSTQPSIIYQGHFPCWPFLFAGHAMSAWPWLMPHGSANEPLSMAVIGSSANLCCITIRLMVCSSSLTVLNPFLIHLWPWVPRLMICSHRVFPLFWTTGNQLPQNTHKNTAHGIGGVLVGSHYKCKFQNTFFYGGDTTRSLDGSWASHANLRCPLLVSPGTGCVESPWNSDLFSSGVVSCGAEPHTAKCGPSGWRCTPAYRRCIWWYCNWGYCQLFLSHFILNTPTLGSSHPYEWAELYWNQCLLIFFQIVPATRWG